MTSIPTPNSIVVVILAEWRPRATLAGRSGKYYRPNYDRYLSAVVLTRYFISHHKYDCTENQGNDTYGGGTTSGDCYNCGKKG